MQKFREFVHSRKFLSAKVSSFKVTSKSTIHVYCLSLKSSPKKVFTKVTSYTTQHIGTKINIFDWVHHCYWSFLLPNLDHSSRKPFLFSFLQDESQHQEHNTVSVIYLFRKQLVGVKEALAERKRKGRQKTLQSTNFGTPFPFLPRKQQFLVQRRGKFFRAYRCD